MIRKNKNEKKEFQEFSRTQWISFVNFVCKCKYGSAYENARNIWPNRIPIKYHYLNVDYNSIIFKYVVKDNRTIGIEFWVPEDPRSTLSCRLINRVLTIEEAIQYITELSESHFSI